MTTKHQKNIARNQTIDQRAPGARLCGMDRSGAIEQWWDRKECGHAISPPTQSWRQIRWDLFNQEGEEMTVFGEYRELIPGKKIVFTWKWDDDEAWENTSSVVTIELSDRDGGPSVLKHEQLPSEEIARSSQ